MALKIGVIVTPPAATSCALVPHCLSRGFGVDVANMVCELLRLNCTFILYQNGAYGDADENGNGTGLIGAIQRGEIDLSLPTLGPTYSRSKAVSFSQNFFYSGIALATRATLGGNSNSFNWSLLFAFQWPVIAVFLITLIIVALLIGLSSKILISGGEKNSHHWTFEFIRIYASLVTKKYDTYLIRFCSLRTLISFWALSSVVLGSAYAGVLFSQKVLLTSNDLPFEDMETFTKCLEERRCQLVQPSKDVFFHLLLTAPDSPLSTRINKALESNPLRVVSKEKIMNAILEERNSYLVWFWPKEQMLYGSEGDDCQFYIIDTPYTNMGSFAVKKASPIMNSLNKAALRFRENAMADFVLQKYGKPTLCSDQRNSDRGLTSWSDEGRGLYASRTIFYVYGIGLICSIAAFAVEFAFYFVPAKLDNAVVPLSTDTWFLT